ncbi:MAG TPA: hypothetical protein VH482_28485 [Thermomicrobiales bacterium]|jgi:hypothetical protein
MHPSDTESDRDVAPRNDDSISRQAPIRLAAPPDEVVDELVAVAGHAGIGLDRDAARDWLRDVTDAVATPGEFSRTIDGEFGGHELALIDFDPSAAARLRRIGRLIATPRGAGVDAALAIAGSAAQGRIQPFPADADFFERIHIAAPDRDVAADTLARVVRAQIEETNAHPGLRFEEVYFGRRRGVSLCWSPAEFAAGQIERRQANGDVIRVGWVEAAGDPGFVKIDWTVVAAELGGPGKASKAIDATWQAPGGAIESLDGAIDADYQQIYLDAHAAELATTLTSGLAPDSRDQYVWHMEHEIAKYADREHGDYAKVAKRLYNLCRLTGRFAEAVYVRELFDEPPARLHQIRLRIELATLLTEAERSALAADLLGLAGAERRWCEDADRVRLCDWAEQLRAAGVLPAATEATADAARRLVSTAFERGLRAYPPISSLLDEIRSRHAASLMRTAG